MTKTKGADTTEPKPKRSRIYIDISPEDRLKLLALQARRGKNKRRLEGFGELAHETWFNKLPNPPRNFKPPGKYRQRRALPIRETITNTLSSLKEKTALTADMAT